MKKEKVNENPRGLLYGGTTLWEGVDTNG